MTAAIDLLKAAELNTQYFGKAGTVPDVAPTEILGDRIVTNVKTVEHRHGAAKYPDMMYAIPGEKADLIVDLTPTSGIRIPMVMLMRHGRDTRDVPKRILEERAKLAGALQNASHLERLQILKAHAYTYENVERLVNANAKIRKTNFIVRRDDLERAADVRYHVGWDRVLRFYQGFKGELHPNATVRAWKRVLYRPVVMFRAAARTLQSVDEQTAKGTRSLWTNVPVAIFISAVVATIALIYMNHQSRLDRQHAEQQLS